MYDAPCDQVKPYNLFVKTYRSLSRINPDILVIDGYSYSSSWAGLLWAKLNGKKTILWSSSNACDHERVFYKEWIKKLYATKFDAANVYGSNSRDYLLSLGVNRGVISIVGNNTDNDFYYKETQLLLNQREELCHQYKVPRNNFLFIGRFSAEKNLFNLIEAYQSIDEKKRSEWGLILLGDGPLREDIDQYIEEHKLSNIILPGFIQKQDIPKFMAISDVLVLPSISEPWGLVINEAMAAGIPCIVSNKCGCYPDLVKDGINGFSFDPYDVSELTAIMNDIVYKRVDLRTLSQNALSIMTQYTPDNAAKIIVETVNQVMETV